MFGGFSFVAVDGAFVSGAGVEIIIKRRELGWFGDMNLG